MEIQARRGPCLRLAYSASVFGAWNLPIVGPASWSSLRGPADLLRSRQSALQGRARPLRGPAKRHRGHARLLAEGARAPAVQRSMHPRQRQPEPTPTTSCLPLSCVLDPLCSVTCACVGPCHMHDTCVVLCGPLFGNHLAVACLRRTVPLVQNTVSGHGE